MENKVASHRASVQQAVTLDRRNKMGDGKKVPSKREILSSMIRLAAQFFSCDRQFLLHYSFCDTVFQSEMRQQASCELNEGAKVLADKVFLFLTPCLLAPSLSLASELLKGILFFFK